MGTVMIINDSFKNSDDDYILIPTATTYFNASEKIKNALEGSTDWLVGIVMGHQNHADKIKATASLGGITPHRYGTKLLDGKHTSSWYRGPEVVMATTHQNINTAFDDRFMGTGSFLDFSIEQNLGLILENFMRLADDFYIRYLGVGPLFWDPYFSINPAIDSNEIVQKVFQEFNTYDLPFDTKIYTKI